MGKRVNLNYYHHMMALLATPSQIAKLKFNYKLILGFVGVLAVFQTFLVYSEFFSDKQLLVDLFTLGLEFTVFGVGAYLAYRYWGSRVFGRSYAILSIGFFSAATGTMLKILGVSTFPSIDSMFFFGLYVCVSVAIYINIKSFNRDLGFKNIMVILPIFMVLVSGFYYITYSEYGYSDFTLHYCGASVVGSAIMASFAFRGFQIVRILPLGRSWEVLASGIFLLALSDIWFHYLDTLDIYSPTHPVNLLMYFGYMVIAYGLYRHKNVF